MGRLFEHPIYLLILLVIILLLFGAPKLPGMARSLGQSMRIFKSEVSEMKDDGKKKESGTSSQVVNGEVINNGHANPGADSQRVDQQTAGGSGNPGPSQEK